MDLKTVLMATTMAAGAALAVPTFVTPAEAAPVCPATDFTGTNSNNCNLTITFSSSGSKTSIQPGATSNYDNTEDALIGVVNNSSTSVTSFKISGSGIFGFDGDGIGVFPTKGGGPAVGTNPSDTTSPPANGIDSGGYGGPSAFFTNVSGNTGTVNFIGGIAPGSSSFFSLEEPVSISSITVGPVPEPASLGMLGAGLVGMALLRRRRKS